MKKLELEDFVIKHKVNQDISKIHFLDNEINQNTGSYPEISFKINEKTIELDKEYDYTVTDETLLNLIINNLLFKEQGENFDITVNDIENFLEIDKRKIISKLYMVSNKIAVESRIGPANSIIVDNHMFFFNRLIQENMGGNFNYYYHKGLGDHIIIFKKTTKEQPHIGLFYSNNKFTYEQVGDYSKFYKILKFEGLKQIRMKKLERITKWS